MNPAWIVAIAVGVVLGGIVLVLFNENSMTSKELEITKNELTNCLSNNPSSCPTTSDRIIDVTETTGPRLLTKNSDESKVFLALGGTNELAILDTQTDKVDLVKLTVTDARDVVAVGNDVVVTGFGSGNIDVVDTMSNPPTVRKTIQVGNSPWGIASDGDLIIVANWRGSMNGNNLGTITVIETPDYTVKEEIALPSTSHGGPWGVDMCPNGPIYVTNDGKDATYKITLDPFDFEEVDTGEYPWDAECSPDGSQLAVVYGGADIFFKEKGDKVQTINPDGTVEWTITYIGEADEEQIIEEFGGGETASVVKKRYGAAGISLIDTTTQDVLHVNLGIGSNVEPWDPSFNKDGTRVYVADMHKDRAIELDTSNGEIINEYMANVAPRSVVIAADKLYIANSGKHQITTKDMGGDYSYDSPEGPGSITIYDLTTGKIVKTILLLPP